jgi:hypothetical protein
MDPKRILSEADQAFERGRELGHAQAVAKVAAALMRIVNDENWPVPPIAEPIGTVAAPEVPGDPAGP